MTIKLMPGAKGTMKKDGTVPILVYISIGDQKSYINTGYFTLRENWNVTGRCVKLPVPNSELINARIAEIRNDIENLMLKNPTLTTPKIKELYERKKDGKGRTTLLEFMAQHIEDCKWGKVLRKGKQLRSGTITNYNTCLRNVKDFSEKFKIDFELINEPLYNSMIRYWRHDKGFSENFIGGLVKNLKVFLTDAFDKGLHTNLEYKKKYFAKPSQKVRHIYLTEDEVLAIKNVKNLPKHLQFERDRFVVATALLLRYSDSILIEKSKFQRIDGLIYFNTITVKTKTDVMLPVPQDIYEMCERNQFSFGKDANPEANWKIKEIGRLAGIKTIKQGKEKWELMTTHTARRTGATLMVLAGVPKDIVMRLGGWSSERSFNLYLCMEETENAVLASKHEYFNRGSGGDKTPPPDGPIVRTLRVA
jgi:integrase